MFSKQKLNEFNIHTQAEGCMLARQWTHPSTSINPSLLPPTVTLAGLMGIFSWQSRTDEQSFSITDFD